MKGIDFRMPFIAMRKKKKEGGGEKIERVKILTVQLRNL
jgi:hypothetical protein